ncbi:MAG: DUF1311 domain-containing protein [Candidatus Competibacteraceae bacterium]|nr:MAG: DUF1311 domain-containing protein [Candidatus Competibacteraceae bacterium]
MNLSFKLIITTVLICANQFAFSTGECDKYTTSYDRTYCFSKLFVESDKELNIVYKELQSKLKSNAKKSLTEVQREWIKYRDDACQPKEGTINVDCNYDINRERTNYLMDRLTECKAGTCRDDMIGSKNWN